jgi:meso-butanediol dehydrogenase / (S,S)-butanediol dehydrogenase / diacetyl reductase
MSAQRFAGKRVLVTGGASGIGRATAEQLGREGASLVLADYDIDGARSVAQSIARESGVAASAVPFDAADAGSCRAMVDAAVESLGGLDVLCNIAGIMDWGGFLDFPEAAWERMLRIDLSSVFYISQRAMPHLISSRGNIVSIASAAGLTGLPYVAAYAAAKAGVIALTRSMAVEFAPQGVRVNAIAPGGVKTPMHAKSTDPVGVDQSMVQKLGERHWPKLGELCEPEDIALALAYLASNDARLVTGIVHIVDGGQLAG